MGRTSGHKCCGDHPSLGESGQHPLHHSVLRPPSLSVPLAQDLWPRAPGSRGALQDWGATRADQGGSGPALTAAPCSPGKSLHLSGLMPPSEVQTHCSTPQRSVGSPPLRGRVP